MRIFTSMQRARIHERTQIDNFIVDRVTDAYEALVNADDVEGYRKHMLDAMAQLDLPMIVPPEERPTAVDQMKVLAIQSIAKQKGWTYLRVQRWVEDATRP